jgi:hypothetical protein
MIPIGSYVIGNRLFVTFHSLFCIDMAVSNGLHTAK